MQREIAIFLAIIYNFDARFHMSRFWSFLFGRKVQYYRKLQGSTQEAFADRIGRAWSYVAKIESPTRAFGVSLETLFKIAEAFMKQLEETPQLMEAFTQKFVEQYGEHIMAQLAKKVTGV